MTGGINAANVRIHDDTEAITRARHALCHQLRVLHNIRIRGPGTHAVAPSASPRLDDRSGSGGKHGASAKLVSLGSKDHHKNHDTGSSHPNHGSSTPVKEFDQQYYRVFHPEDSNFEDEPQGPDIQEDGFQSTSLSSTGINSKSGSAMAAGGEGQTLFSSFWWLLRDLLLLLCVIGIIYILLYCCCCNASSPAPPPLPETPEGTFDAVY